jgi:23S rRNA (cytidine1920-2'-O)/16S rRNA (cytidine1409-2'-O)-methyltransferase
MKAPKTRIDRMLVERGLAETRERAQRLIMAGQVVVNSRTIDKPGTRIPSDADVQVTGRLPYVSRGGLKLEAALDAFRLGVSGQAVADVGASTGGFTDCLLQRGAARVYAIDVGYGQLAWKLRQDSRVIVMERTNARYLEALPERVHVAVVDVSFISLRLILPAVAGWLSPGAHIVSLIKPQFEAGKRQVGKGGVVRDPAVHRQVLERILGWAQERNWALRGLIRSPITGPAGNAEFLAGWQPGSAVDGLDRTAAIDACLTKVG